MEGKSFKHYGILLGLLLIIGLIFPLTAFAADYTPSLTKTDGVYTISTLAQLESFRADLAATGSTGYLNETVVLTADIQIEEGNELSIINSNFNGTFDGLGHKITLSNLEVVAQRSIIPRNFGIIKDLNVVVNEGATKTESTAARSPLCDSNYGRIEYVKVEGNIKIAAANTKAITVAGIAGSNGNAGNIIENSISSINYTLEGTNDEIVAYQGRTQGVSLYQFYASGNGDLNKCYSLGKVINSDFAKPTATGGRVAIGLAVFTGGTGQGVSYYNSENLIPAVIFGSAVAYKDTPEKVIGKTTAELKDQSTFAGWDFDKIWNISPETNAGYPYLDIRTAVKRLSVKPTFEEKIWNDGSDLTAKVTGMEFAGLSEAEKALVEKYKITINFDPINDVKSAAFKSMQNLGWRDVTVEYNTQPTITVGDTATASTDGYTFVFDGVVTGQARIVDNGTPGPDKTEQDAQIAKAKEANTIIFEKYIGDGSTYLTPLTVIGDLPGDKIFPQDLWAMFSAARGGYVPGGDTAFYDKWFANVKTSLHTLKEGGLKPEDMKVTEWTKLVLAITAAGYDARDIEDFDLIKIISDKSYLNAGLILQKETAILALVGGGYPVTTDNPIVDFATIAQKGAVHLNGWIDSSLTYGDNAMFIQYYGFYMNDNADLKAAIENLMYNRVGGDNPILQNGDGSFTSTGYDLNAYNNAQNMIALGCFNMSVFDDHFIQNGNTVLDSQFNFIDFNNRTYQGSYEITQLTRGFTAAIRQYEGRNQIFDTSDIVGATKPVNDLLMALTETSTPEQIAAAKTAYNALSDAKKATIKTENLRKLYTVDSVKALIAALPQLDVLTSADKDKLSEARTAYGVLKTEDQASVTNIETLQKLEEKMSVLLVIDQITALPVTVTLDDKPAVTAARKAYDGLTKEQKDLINSDTTTKLTVAEARIKALEEAGQVSTDQKAANAVIAKIDDLGTITSYSQKAAVEAARSAYQALTSIQKNLVTNLAKLEAAETAVSKLSPEITITVDVERFAIGQGFYVEPTTLAVKEGTTARAAVEQLLGTSNVIGEVGYLRAIVGADTGVATIPDYIIKELGAGNSSVANAYGQEYSGNTLGEKDYSSQSGWMYFVNNSTPSVGMNEKILKSGDVLRLAFTYWGTGADVTGSGIDVNGTLHKMSFTPANRDALLKVVAKVNDNAAYRSDAAISKAYDTAMTVVQDMTAVAKVINEATTALNKAIADYKPGNTGDDTKIAKAVTDQIAALPAVAKLVLTDKAAVTAARTAYDALTAAQKALVTNLSTLTAAEAKITELQTAADQVAAKAVTDKIAALPTVAKLVLTDKDAVAAARAAYDALSEAQKKLVTNLSTLTAAEAQMAKLLAGEATEADKAAAKAVSGQIGGLPSGDKLMLGSKADVAAARAAYNALTDIQKSLITDLDALTAAEARIAELEKATPPAKDEATGIEVVGLPEGVSLKVEPESGDATKTDEAQKAATEAGIKDAKIISLYSIKPDMSDDDLAKFNSDPDSFVTLTMPLIEDQQGYDSYKIYHKKTDGTVEWITPTLSADGKSLIFKVNAFSEFGVVATKASTEIPTVDFSYRTHVQNVGWQDWKNNGAMSGTQGQSLRLEGIEIKRADTADVDLGIRYETHIENIGWEDSWKADGKMSGTEGRSLRLEAIRIELTGADAANYDVYYQVHAQNTGWMAFAKNGADAGTAGFGYRLEGIHVVVVPKGQAVPTPETGSIDTAFLVKN